MPLSPSDPITLLRKRITESGLSNRKYAETVLTRDERTVRRWLSGKSPLPKVVIDFLTRAAPPS